MLLALGEWGIDAPEPSPPAALSATSVLIFLRLAARADPAAPPMNCRLELDGRVWTVRLASGRVEVEPGEPATAAPPSWETCRPSTGCCTRSPTCGPPAIRSVDRAISARASSMSI